MSRKLVIVVLVALAIGLFFALDLGRYFDLAYLKSQQASFAALYARNPLATLAAYFAVYVAVAALSLPGAAVLTLAGGALFGFWTGLIVVSFASSIGALAAMLAARLVLGETVQRRFGNQLAAINSGIERDGPFYLFALRLVPVFPFFVINLLMGLTKIRAFTFYWVSQVGMLLGTAVYVNVGTQLAQVESLRGVLSPGLLVSFVLLGIFPLIAKKLVDRLRARKVYARWAATGRKLRLQHGRDRRWLRGPGFGLHRRRHQGQGRADREAPDGRRLPQYRMRAEQGADPLGQAVVACRTEPGVRVSTRAPRSTSPMSWIALQRVVADGRAARFGRTLHGARGRLHRWNREDHDTVDDRSRRRPRACGP